MERYPQTEETSLAKKWYEDNGKPFPLEWSKSEIIKGNKGGTTIVVPLENGLNLGPDNSIQQNLVFTIDEHDVVKGNKVVVFSDTRTITEHGKEAISKFVKKQDSNSQDQGKVYFLVYDLKESLLYSQLLDAEGFKPVNLRLTTKNKDSKVKAHNDAPSTGKNIPVVCKEWYLVEYYDDGSEYWMYLYTACSGSGSGNGGGGGGGTGGGGGGASYLYESPSEPINLQQLLNCFNNVPSNAQTTYKITIHAHLANPNNVTQVYNFSTDDPGHAYITMQKSNGSTTRSLTFGFYPSSDSWMTAVKDAEGASIGREDPQQRRSDASYTINVTAATFNNARNIALTGSTRPYDLNDYNCTDYAEEVFNAALGGAGLAVPNSTIGYTTPAGLYGRLSQMKTAGVTGISLTQSMAPTSTPACN
ncbi:hypothetical protein LZQ00_08580 [Sphingobacterium sp. SRCM116780]|uniref:hypothetical protein n=1 Tax=Sphingobacterium sp. SRCM116780 TaxID=2907623 RepID=UPI001F1BFB77|nr:hypothetical protein [Sphingobacterium sp. SRCM116780]UIR57861.1 hypothetical protein LZQ00_08580 [Sphingobacterium sp. SRCM116780]